MEDHTDLIESLFGLSEDYAKTNIELGKLQVAQGTTTVLSTLIAQSVVMFTGSMFLLILSVGAAFWLGQLLGEVYYGFFIVAGFYAVLGLMFYLFLPGWIRKPIRVLVNNQAFNMPLLTNNEMEAAMASLKEEKLEKGKILKEHLHRTFESLKPVNLVKNAVHEIVTSEEVQQDVITTATSLAAGYVAKKIVGGSSKNTFRNVAGTLFQMGVSNVMLHHQKEVAITLKVLKSFLTGKKSKNGDAE